MNPGSPIQGVGIPGSTLSPHSCPPAYPCCRVGSHSCASTGHAVLPLSQLCLTSCCTVLYFVPGEYYFALTQSLVTELIKQASVSSPGDWKLDWYLEMPGLASPLASVAPFPCPLLCVSWLPGSHPCHCSHLHTSRALAHTCPLTAPPAAPPRPREKSRTLHPRPAMVWPYLPSCGFLF